MNKNVIEIVFCRQSAWGSAYTQRIVSRKSSSSVYLSLSECFLCCTCFKVITCVGVKPRTCFEGNLFPYVTRTRAYLFAEYVSRSGLDRLRHITYCGQSFYHASRVNSSIKIRETYSRNGGRIDKLSGIRRSFAVFPVFLVKKSERF